MHYQSTRGNYQPVSAAEAIKTGMVPGGGLFVPSEIPKLDIEGLNDLSYAELACRIFEKFLPDFSGKQIKEMVNQVYKEPVFGHPEIAPVVPVHHKLSVLELWHGPTAAFKDMALQILPHLMTASLQKLDYQKELLILVATSGDTGKAALEGFKNIPGINIMCLFPHQKVSKIQELQMTTTDGENTKVVAVKGNFDDCQAKVKEIFSDQAFQKELLEANTELSSANSINWGRLLPQIVYYYHAYLDSVRKGQLTAGQKINIVVPTGNFGNILAAWYAKKMGLPVNTLVCASNINNILTDFINTGKYDTHRLFIETNSPSMDILISSNLERYIYELTGRDDSFVNEVMTQLQEANFFQLDSQSLTRMQEELYGDYATEEETAVVIKECFDTYGYVFDTHTAVGMKVYQKYVAETKDSDTFTILDATANPYKFNKSVLEALKGAEAVADKDEFEILSELAETTGLPIHPGLKDLDKKEVIHQDVAELGQITDMIREFIK